MTHYRLMTCSEGLHSRSRSGPRIRWDNQLGHFDAESLSAGLDDEVRVLSLIG